MLVIGIRVQACKRPVCLVSMNVRVEAKTDPEDLKGARREGQHRESSGCGWRNCLQYGGNLRIY